MKTAALLAALAGAAGAAAGPVTCQPFRQFPDYPQYHVMGYVHNDTAGRASGREAINDCSGIVQYKGLYHIFHQCCQNHWDHLISADLIHWTRLPPPVRPNRTDPAQWYDHSGSYDGGVSMLDPLHGGPTIVYDVIECRSCTIPGCKCDNHTAGRQLTPMDPPFMGVARPIDPTDPHLLQWTKDPHNPINFTGGGSDRWR